MRSVASLRHAKCATTRLRQQIASMFADFAERCADSATDTPIGLDFPFTQTDIANIFDVTRQSVQRESIFFKDHGPVEKRDGAWLVIDLAQLRRIV